MKEKKSYTCCLTDEAKEKLKSLKKGTHKGYYQKQMKKALDVLGVDNISEK